ncbi:MAG TPA: toprim domain-containing protein [Caldilineaceae bacterium]|mgnify:CR=1 FL=1|nr:toprim domain-containing protein [Caldilineaceae bacterium]
MTTQTIERVPAHLIEQAKAADLVSLAERHTELHKAAANEWAGPCPKCGGSDRFHCTAEWFFCRQCHSKKGDSIEFMRWVYGHDFRQAVEALTGTQMPAPTARKAPERKAPPAAADPDWQAKAKASAERAHDALFDAPEAAPGRDYLEGRGLAPHTWSQYKLGYAPAVSLPGTEGKQRVPGIVIPWYVAGKVCAIRYRFLCEDKHIVTKANGEQVTKKGHKYIDIDGNERVEKQSALFGSQFAGRLFGGQALMGCAENHRWLLICEGEINAMSIWQVAGDTGLDVLSLGGQDSKLSPKAIEYAQQYKRVLVWADKGDIAQKLMAALLGAYGMRSPGGKDANDLLKLCLLGGHLATVRIDAAQSPTELEALLWSLYDAMLLPSGIDDGTAAVLRQLAERLGKEIAIFESAPRRWGGHSEGDP